MAVSAYIRAAGWDNRAEIKASGADFHVVRALVEYKVGIGHDEELAIGVRTTRIGNSSIAFQPAIFHADGERLLATGEIVWVWTDQASKRPIPVPDRLRALLTRFDGG
jgi:acyl-CoA thioester hydrolase